MNTDTRPSEKEINQVDALQRCLLVREVAGVARSLGPGDRRATGTGSGRQTHNRTHPQPPAVVHLTPPGHGGRPPLLLGVVYVADGHRRTGALVARPLQHLAAAPGRGPGGAPSPHRLADVRDPRRCSPARPHGLPHRRPLCLPLNARLAVRSVSRAARVPPRRGDRRAPARPRSLAGAHCPGLLLWPVDDASIGVYVGWNPRRHRHQPGKPGAAAHHDLSTSSVRTLVLPEAALIRHAKAGVRTAISEPSDTNSASSSGGGRCSAHSFPSTWITGIQVTRVGRRAPPSRGPARLRLKASLTRAASTQAAPAGVGGRAARQTRPYAVVAVSVVTRQPITKAAWVNHGHRQPQGGGLTVADAKRDAHRVVPRARRALGACVI